MVENTQERRSLAHVSGALVSSEHDVDESADAEPLREFCPLVDPRTRCLSSNPGAQLCQVLWDYREYSGRVLQEFDGDGAVKLESNSIFTPDQVLARRGVDSSRPGDKRLTQLFERALNSVHLHGSALFRTLPIQHCRRADLKSARQFANADPGSLPSATDMAVSSHLSGIHRSPSVRL
ncbi:hypothetical protein ACPPVQ_00580 [Diaminobutyricibacter sp. McL0618]|uniref:hypothetical protein n=1 Tax=Leifsonia sp. McL0618 TaxID=3415677 RepID=UPI003CE78267